MSIATLHLTELLRLAAPTPMMAVVLVWVVDTGMPVSTTHTKTTAIMGVGAAKRKSSVKWSVAIDMVKTWVLTFPGCGLLGFVFARIFLAVM